MKDGKSGDSYTSDPEEWKPITDDFQEIGLMYLYGLFVYIFTALYLIFIPISIQSIWVLINIVIGYAILSNKKARNYFGKLFLGFLEKKVWLYAIINIVMIFSTLFAPSLFASDAGNDVSGNSKGNPFISNLIFLLAILPIVPLFADAETRLFQGLIIKGFHKQDLIKCKKCGKMALPQNKCDICRAKLLENPINDFVSYFPAIIISGIIFGLAHVVLIGSIIPIVLTVGGVFLGILYVKEGANMVAKVHMVYNYVVICLILFGGLI